MLCLGALCQVRHPTPCRNTLPAQPPAQAQPCRLCRPGRAGPAACGTAGPPGRAGTPGSAPAPRLGAGIERPRPPPPPRSPPGPPCAALTRTRRKAARAASASAAAGRDRGSDGSGGSAIARGSRGAPARRDSDAEAAAPPARCRWEPPAPPSGQGPAAPPPLWPPLPPVRPRRLPGGQAARGRHIRGGDGTAMAAAFKTVEPLEYYRRFLKENCRPDGRELGEFRTTTVNIGSITTADGSALVKLGNTTVICGIKAELAAPAVDSANKGYIVPNVELPSLCAERFRSGPPGEEAQAASQYIADVIENSQMIVKEDLCIANGKLAWVLYCDIICLDYDGNLLDASVFALLAALKNVQLPLVTINEETGLSEVNLKQKNPLIIRKHPVATSFAVFDDTLLIVDPTAEEEDLATGTVTIVTDEEGRLCSVHKPGGSPLTGAKLQDCITRAITRHKEVKKLIDKVIKSITPK
uniref:Exosome complex component RRP43 n=2 Tax=Zonotrichia TaxID=44387 RepID=A0A8D2M9G6_ZONAL